jgi:purine nucleosidase
MMRAVMSILLSLSALLIFAFPVFGQVQLIFDTDMGNDIDDALALAVIHDLMDRGETELLAVTISKDNPWCAPYLDLINTFYGRPDISIGMVREGKRPEDGKFIRKVVERKRDGAYVYPRDLHSGDDAEDAVLLMRRILAAVPDTSVVIASVGFATNLADLLQSPSDSYSQLNGVELVRKKVKLLSWMAGNFSQPRMPEYNARVDSVATQVLLHQWPRPILASGWEVGVAVKYPATSIENDYNYVADHPVSESYRHYYNRQDDKTLYDRPSWDLTSVLLAVRPEHEYFGLAYPGVITMDDEQVTYFAENPNGLHRFLTISPEQVIRVREALVQLASSPPGR